MPFKSGRKNSYIASKGGRKGGPARAASLTPERRKEIAIKAVTTRWAKAKRAQKELIIHTKTDYLRLLGEIEELICKDESEMSPEEIRLLELWSKLAAAYEKALDPIV